MPAIVIAACACTQHYMLLCRSRPMARLYYRTTVHHRPCAWPICTIFYWPIWTSFHWHDNVIIFGPIVRCALSSGKRTVLSLNKPQMLSRRLYAVKGSELR